MARPSGPVRSEELVKLVKFVAMLAVVLGVSSAGSRSAEAAPVFQLPDWNYVTAGPTLTFAGPLSSPTGYTLVESPSQGDLMSVNTGKGFSVVPNSLNVSVFGNEGTLTFSNSSGTLFQGSLVSSATQNSLVGKEILSTFRLTSSNLPFANTKVGSLIAFDAFAFNITTTDGVSSGQAKGDFAPVVPEPGTLLLLLGGLGSLVARARRLRPA
jgi:hypothetical protein